MSDRAAFLRGWVSGTRRAYGLGLVFSLGAAMPDRLPLWVPAVMAACYSVAAWMERRPATSPDPRQP